MHGGARLHRRHTRDRAFRHMHRHRDAVLVRQVGDFFQFQRAAARQDVRVDDRHAARFDQRPEALFEVHILAGTDRDAGAAAQADVLVGVHPRDHVLHPRQIVRLHPPGKADAVFDAHMAEMVDRQRHFIPDDTAHLADVVFEEIQPLFREVNPGEGVRRVH